MRKIHIDLSPDDGVSQYRFAGYEGEHNATLLTVTLPERMLLEEGGEYRFLFETAKGEAVFSAALHPENGSLSVPLAKALTVPPVLKAYVGKYVEENGELTLVAKTPEMLLGVQKSIGEAEKMNVNGGCVPGLVVEDALNENSKNPVTGGAVYAALKEKLSKEALVEELNEASPSHLLAASEKAVSDALKEKLSLSDLTKTLGDAQNASDAAVPTEKAVAEALLPYMKKEEYQVDPALSTDSSNPVENWVITASFAPNLKGKAKGKFIYLTDASPLPQEIRVEMKKIVPASYSPLRPIQREANAYISLMKSGFGTYQVQSITSPGPSGGPNYLTFTDGSYWEDSAEGMLHEASDFSDVKEGDILFYLPFDESEMEGVLYTSLKTEEGEAPAPNATLTLRGKNLFDVGEKSLDFYHSLGYIKEVSSEDQTITAVVFPYSESHLINVKNRYPSGTYTVSAEQNNEKKIRFVIRLYNAEGKELAAGQASVSGMAYNSHYKGWFFDGNSLTFTVPDTASYWCLGFSPTGVSGENVVIGRILLTPGEEKAEYEKCQSQFFTSDENGVVRGIAVSGENISLFSEENTWSELEYNRDLTEAILRIENAIVRMGGELK